MARMKYVQRRANRFEFRYPLPDDLAGKPFPTPWPEQSKWIVNERTGRFKTELIKALGTNEARVAERAALPLIAEAHGLVDQAQKRSNRACLPASRLMLSPSSPPSMRRICFDRMKG